jgi:isoamylase
MTGQHVEEAGVKDVSWINANRSEMTSEHWQDSGMDCFGMSLDGRAQATGIRKSSKDATLQILLSRRKGGRLILGNKHGVTARSLLLLVLRT